MKILSFVIILFSISNFSQAADEICLLTISVTDVTFVNSEIDQSVAVSLDLDRLNTNKKCKKYTLGISTGSSSSYDRKMYNGTSTVAYNFYKNESTTKVIKDLNDGGKRDHVSIDFKNSTSKTITVFARMPNPFVNGSLTPGQYMDSVAFNIEASDKNATGTSTKNVAVSLYIPTEINISLVPKGQGYDENQTSYALNYGVMIAGQSKGLHLIVKANAGYEITASSDGDGRMRHIETPSNYVDYSFKVNSIEKSLIGSLTNAVSLYTTTSGSPEEGEVINIDVSIVNVDNKLSGTYRDFIYINAISNQ